MNDLRSEKYKVLAGLVFPALFVLLLWIIRLVESLTESDFTTLGLYPLNPHGLIGIITGPLIHGNWKHLANNSVPLLFLGWTVFYFYKEIAFKVFFLIYFLSQLWLWFFLVRPAWIIGASGLVYGMAGFVFVSGIIRKNKNLMAISLLVSFLYGSMVWGIFPYEEEISWEGHLMGLMAGIILAFYYKDYGPALPNEPENYQDDDEDDDEFEDKYWLVDEESTNETDNTQKNPIE
jgi:membrane associated rhomboid family serine protease